MAAVNVTPVSNSHNELLNSFSNQLAHSRPDTSSCSFEARRSKNSLQGSASLKSLGVQEREIKQMQEKVEMAEEQVHQMRVDC